MPKTVDSFEAATEVGDYHKGLVRVAPFDKNVWISGDPPTAPTDIAAANAGTDLELVNSDGQTNAIAPSAIVLGTAPHNELKGYEVDVGSGSGVIFKLKSGEVHELKIWVKLTTQTRISFAFFSSGALWTRIFDVENAAFLSSEVLTTDNVKVDQLEVKNYGDAGTLAHLRVDMPKVGAATTFDVRFAAYTVTADAIQPWTGAVAYEVIEQPKKHRVLSPVGFYDAKDAQITVNTQFNTGLNLGDVDYIEFSIVDDVANRDPWARSMIDISYFPDSGIEFIRVDTFDTAHVNIIVDSIETGSLRFTDHVRGIRLLFIRTWKFIELDELVKRTEYTLEEGRLAAQTMAYAQTDGSLSISKKAGWDADTKTWLFDSASGDVPYDPSTGLWTLEVTDNPRKFLLEGALSLNNMHNTDYGDVAWFDEAGNRIDEQWTANGSAVGGNTGFLVTNLTSHYYEGNAPASAIVTVTSTVKVRLSVIFSQGSFDSLQGRSFIRIMELPLGQIVQPTVMDPDLIVPQDEVRYQLLISQPAVDTKFTSVLNWHNTVSADALGGAFQAGDRIILYLDIGTLVAVRDDADPGEVHYHGRDQRPQSTNTRTGIRINNGFIQHRGVDTESGSIRWVTVERRVESKTVTTTQVEKDPPIHIYAFTTANEENTSPEYTVPNWAEMTSQGYTVGNASLNIQINEDGGATLGWLDPGAFMASADARYQARWGLYDSGNLGIWQKGAKARNNQARLAITWVKSGQVL